MTAEEHAQLLMCAHLGVQAARIHVAREGGGGFRAIRAQGQPLDLMRWYPDFEELTDYLRDQVCPDDLAQAVDVYREAYSREVRRYEEGLDDVVEHVLRRSQSAFPGHK